MEFKFDADSDLKLLESPKRLAILASAKGVDAVAFRYLADRLGVADAELSRDLRYLKLAGFVKTRKVGRQSWVSITDDGEQALRDYRLLLREILAEADREKPATKPHE